MSLPPINPISPDNESAEWVQDNLNAIAKYGRNKPEPYQLSDFDKRAVAILAKAFRMGIYNVPVNWEKVDWRFGAIGVRFPMSFSKELATWDFDHLTRLVIAGHDECVRISVDGGKAGRMNITMFPREGREGGMAKRHPTIETAIEDFRR